MSKVIRWCFLLAFLIASDISLANPFRNGDIIFQTSSSSQSRAIQKATHSRFSHVGIIFLKNGNPYVFEAVGTVQSTPVKEWIARGEGRHYVVKRLSNADKILTPAAVAKLQKVAGTFRGKPYDLAFGWSDERIYCSELVWKIYAQALSIHVGTLRKLRDFDLSDKTVKAKIRERYGRHVPLDETVISPGDIFSSANLILVEEK